MYEYMANIDNFCISLIVIALGLIIGSFITMASYRIPRSEDLVFTGSHCQKCSHLLTIKNLVPLFSWLWQLGKCNYCGARISIRYPLIEVITAILFWLAYWNFGCSPLMAVMLGIITCLIIATVTDLENYIIPDSIQAVMLVLAFAYHVTNGTINHIFYYLISGVIAVAIGFILYFGFLFIRKKEALGMGDIKFFGIVGLLLGAKSLVTFFLLSGILGVILGLIWKALTKSKVFPFGPALIISLLVHLFYPVIGKWLWY